MLLAFETESDKDKFEYIYNKYKRLLLYKAYEILKNEKLAEDAASEAFLRIYRNLHKIVDVDSNATVAFIVTIVKNTALTLLKKEKVGYEPDESLADDFDLENYVLSEISSTNIYRLINTLNENIRDVFLLKYAHNLSHKEIGGILHMTENNVTVTLHRAKKKLSKLLVKEGYVNEKQR